MVRMRLEAVEENERPFRETKPEALAGSERAEVMRPLKARSEDDRVPDRTNREKERLNAGG
jgi:hypothetical protein